MACAQQRIRDMAYELSDDDANMIAGFMSRLIVLEKDNKKPVMNEKKQAYLSLKEMIGGFPADFDSDKEIATAREKKYGTID